MPKKLSQAKVTEYRALIKRNREIEKLIQELRAEQARNGRKAMALVVKYPAVKRLHKSR